MGGDQHQKCVEGVLARLTQDSSPSFVAVDMGIMRENGIDRPSEMEV